MPNSDRFIEFVMGSLPDSCRHVLHNRYPALRLLAGDQLVAFLNVAAVDVDVPCTVSLLPLRGVVRRHRRPKFDRTFKGLNRWLQVFLLELPQLVAGSY